MNLIPSLDRACGLLPEAFFHSNENMGAIIWHQITQILLDDLYPDHHPQTLKSTNSVVVPNSFLGAICKLNSHYQNKLVENISIITFLKFYPHITVQLYQSGDLVFSDSRFGDLFTYLITQYKKTPTTEPRYHRLIKVWINYTFGILHSSNIKVQNGFACVGAEKIVDQAREIATAFLNDYPEIIYVDTDEIYYPGILPPQMISDLNQLNLPYEIETVDRGLFLDRKKLLLFQGEPYKVRGIRKA